MKIEKLNELAYVFRFGSDIEAKRIFTFLYKSCETHCERDTFFCENCEILKECCEFWKQIEALPKIP